MESFTSRLNADRFCVNLRQRQRAARQSGPSMVLLPRRAPARTDLSLFLVRRLRSMPSMRFSKQRCIACCFSGGWLFTMLFLKSEKYWAGQEKDGLIPR